MNDRTTLALAAVSAVVTVGGMLLTGWGTSGTWAVPLVAGVVFVVLASVHEYAVNRAR